MKWNSLYLKMFISSNNSNLLLFRMKGKKSIIKTGGHYKQIHHHLRQPKTHFRYLDASPIWMIGLGNESVQITEAPLYMNTLNFKIISTCIFSYFKIYNQVFEYIGIIPVEFHYWGVKQWHSWSWTSVWGMGVESCRLPL